jgi:hypothetical protein
MGQIGTTATQKAAAMLSAASGLPHVLAGLTEEISGGQLQFQTLHVLTQNVAPEVSDRALGLSYPAVYLYCGVLSNSLQEKFRTFSGQAEMIAEVRVTQDRLDGLDNVSQMMADAVTQVLDASRGDWGDGYFYAGGYEVQYGPAKSGGKNFLQTAKIKFDLEISI